MSESRHIIDSLVADASPVRRLRPPSQRALGWLALAVAVVVLLALIYGVRPDWADRLRDPVFVFGQGAAAVTGAAAALAALMASLPDRSRSWLLLPLPPAALWVSTVTYGCLAHWVTLDPNRLALGEALSCVAILLATSVPLSAFLFFLLRPLARVRPRGAVLTAGLAVAGFTATALNLLHAFDASVMILVWNFGAAALVLAADAAAGRAILDRRAPMRTA